MFISLHQFLVAACRLCPCGTGALLLHGMWGSSSPTRDQTCIPCITRWILNCTTRGVPWFCVFELILMKSYCMYSSAICFLNITFLRLSMYSCSAFIFTTIDYLIVEIVYNLFMLLLIAFGCVISFTNL